MALGDAERTRPSAFSVPSIFKGENNNSTSVGNDSPSASNDCTKICHDSLSTSNDSRDKNELFEVDKVKDFYNLVPVNKKEFLIMKNTTHAKIPLESWQQVVVWLDKTNK